MDAVARRWEIFVGGNERDGDRPYIRVVGSDGHAEWYCWGIERGGGWVHLTHPPMFTLRDITGTDEETAILRKYVGSTAHA